MSQHPSLKRDKWKSMRSVRKRWERVQKLERNLKWLEQNQSVYGLPKEKIFRLKKLIKKEKPDIVFVSEPIYCWYYHGDHVNTGKAVYYCIYNKIIDCTPILYFYGTLTPNYIFGFKKEDFELFEQMRQCHKTQFWLTYKLHRTFKLSTRLAAIKLRGWKYAEKYRRVYFNEKNLKKNKPSMRIQIISHFFSSLPFFIAQYPQEILDRLKKEGKI